MKKFFVYLEDAYFEDNYKVVETSLISEADTIAEAVVAARNFSKQRCYIEDIYSEGEFQEDGEDILLKFRGMEYKNTYFRISENIILKNGKVATCVANNILTSTPPQKPNYEKMRKNWVDCIYRQYVDDDKARAVCHGSITAIVIFNKTNPEFGIARKNPADVEDSSMGVAIAYARATGKKIPEFVLRDMK